MEKTVRIMNELSRNQVSLPKAWHLIVWMTERSQFQLPTWFVVYAGKFRDSRQKSYLVWCVSGYSCPVLDVSLFWKKEYSMLHPVAIMNLRIQLTDKQITRNFIPTTLHLLVLPYTHAQRSPRHVNPNAIFVDYWTKVSNSGNHIRQFITTDNA